MSIFIRHVGIVIATVFATSMSIANQAPPTNERMLFDFAGNALQKLPGAALSLEAGKDQTRARIDWSSSLPALGDSKDFFQHIDVRLSGPLDLSEDASEGDTSAFGDAIVGELAWNLIQWKPSRLIGGGCKKRTAQTTF